MNSRPPSTLESQLAGALDWWRLAGVDLAFTDDPVRWLAADEPTGDSAAQASADTPARPGTAARPAAIAPDPPAMRIGAEAADWPRDLAAFQEWWLSEPSLDTGGIGARVAPHGEAGARLMILVPMPDTDHGDTLFSGRQGALLTGMLAAMGIKPEDAYLAAALPRHMAHPDWAELNRGGLGKIVQYHLGLARPRRMLVLGRGILPLLGHDPAQSPAVIKQTAILDASNPEPTPIQLPTLVGFAPDRLLESARQRAMLWRQWLDWTDADA